MQSKAYVCAKVVNQDGKLVNDLLTFEERREVLSEISFHLERNKSLMFVMDNCSGRNGFMKSKPFISP